MLHDPVPRGPEQPTREELDAGKAAFTQQFEADHPDAIKDPAKAQYMAEAGKEHEEALIVAREAALEAGVRATAETPQTMTYKGSALHPEAALDRATTDAEDARRKADEAYEKTDGLYDRMQHISQGKK